MSRQILILRGSGTRRLLAFFANSVGASNLSLAHVVQRYGCACLAVLEIQGSTIKTVHATTDTSPCGLRVDRTVISTSCPRAVRKSMRRSTEKAPERLRIKADTWGCLI